MGSKRLKRLQVSKEPSCHALGTDERCFEDAPDSHVSVKPPAPQNPSQSDAASRPIMDTERRLRLAIEASRLGLWDWNALTEIFTCSPVCGEILGLGDQASLRCDQLQAIVHPEDLPRCQSVLDEILKCPGGEDFTHPFRVILPGGSPRWVEIRGKAICDEETAATHLVGTALDITDRKETERAWETRVAVETRTLRAQKDESLAVLAGGVAHDFNNLLVSVIGFAHLTLAQLPDSSPLRELVENIKQSGMRAAELSKQMLAYSGRGQLSVAPVDINQLARDAMPLLRSSIPRTIRLAFEPTAGVPLIQADAGQIRQVLVDLVLNASEAIGALPGGSIVVRARTAYVDPSAMPLTQSVPDMAPGYYVCLEVSDNGCGIDDHIKSKLFEPFFSTKFTGRGLGLSTVWGIVRGHKGAISVTSAPQHGATFDILFPVAPEAIPEPVVTAAHPTLSSRPKGLVLIVDDEPAVREILKLVLEDSGIHVLLACNGQEGIDLLTEHLNDIRAIILDLTMPVMGGEQALRYMRQIAPRMPVLLTSGYNEKDATAGFVDLKIAGFIPKPFRPSDILEKLADVMSNE